MHSPMEDSLALESTNKDSTLPTTLQDQEIPDISLTDQLASLTSTLSLSSSTVTKRGSLLLDSRVPFEIWDHISLYLRPPELFVLSRVSQSLFRHVRSFMVWKTWWYEYDQQAGELRLPIVSHPDPQYYMRCMFAIHPLMCEDCGTCASLDRLPEDAPWKIPLSWEAKSYSAATILLCGPCRVIRYTRCPRKKRYKLPYPKDIVGSFMLKTDIIQKYARYRSNIGQDTVKSIQTRRRSPGGILYSECIVWEILRERRGGDRGVFANLCNVHQIERKTRHLLYRLSSLEHGRNNPN